VTAHSDLDGIDRRLDAARAQLPRAGAHAGQVRDRITALERQQTDARRAQGGAR
jgi:hypothetical protein